jgi:DNA-binding winged helix-turn-helix (wHTH) protein
MVDSWSSARLRFGECVLDARTRELWRGDEPAHLTPKAYELLQLLLAKRPAAVSKGEIHEALWPSTFVAEVNLSTLMVEIRHAIGDSPRRPKYVRTIRGFGYAFCAAAVTEGAVELSRRPSSCRLIWGEREIALAEGENILGRVPEAVAWIDHASVSRRHARVVVEHGAARLEDLGSKNGTYVGKRRISGSVALENGSEIRLGTVPMRFRVVTERGTTRTAPPEPEQAS